MASNTIQFDATVDAAALNRLLGELKTGTAGAAKAINDLLGGTVTKKIVLQEVSDGSGGKKLVAVEKERLSVTDQIISKQKQLNATQAGSVTSLRQQLNSLKQARDATVRYEQSTSAIGGRLRQQRAEWAAINAQVSQVSRSLAVASASGFWDQIKVATRSQGLINISNGLVSITQGFQAASILAGQFLGAINSVVDASAKLQSFALAFKAIGAGTAGAVTGLQESSRIALGLGVELNTVIEGFRQLSPVVLNSGGTLGDVSAIVESLSSRFAAFGISGDRARRVMNGVIQAFSKGRLQAEELTQQISEADPAFKTDLAAALLASKDSLGELGKEIDGTIPNLEKLVKAQKLTSEVLIKVLPELSKSSLLYGQLGSSAGSSVDALERSAVTIDQVRANLKNLNELSLRDLALSSTPLINALLRVQAVITDTFTRISKSDGFKVLSSVAAELVTVIAKLADGLFALVEGAVGVVGALKPVVDLAVAIAQIPGVAQLAGVALIGKFLGPLNLLEKRIGSTKAAFQGFKGAITDVFRGSRAQSKSLTSDIRQINAELGRPVGGSNRPQGQASRISDGTRKAVAEITALGKTSATEIQSQITKLEAGIERSRAKLAALGDTGSAKPTRAQRDLQDQIQRTTNLLESQKRLMATRAGTDPSSQANMRLQAEITTTEQKLDGLRQKLTTDAQGFSEKEVRRQQGLKSAIDANISRVADLRAELAKQSQSTTQERRTTVGFDPKSTEAVRKATEDYSKSLRDNTKERIKSSDFAKGGLSSIADREQQALKRLQEIDKERANIQKRASQTGGFKVAGFSDADFGADRLKDLGKEVDQLRGKLGDLGDERSRLLNAIEGAAAAEADVAKILDDGNKSTATATERQRALVAQREIFTRQSKIVAQQLAAEVKALERLEKSRASLEGRRLSGKLDDPTGGALQGLDARINDARAAVKGLIQEQNRLATSSSLINSNIAENAVNLGRFGGALGRAGANVKAFGGGLFNVGKNVLTTFKNGISSLLGSLDPLLVVMLAVGVGSRLYADGTKDATAATERYAEQSRVLQAALNDISPGLGAAKEQTTALGRAWDSLAVATVGVGDALASTGEKLAKLSGSAISGLKDLLAGLNDELVNLAGSLALVSGTTALGAALGSIGGPAGIVALGTIGAIVGIISALGLGSSQSAIDLAKLEKELKAIDAGSSAAVGEVSNLATALEGLQKDQTGNYSQSDSTKITEGYKALSSAVETSRKEIQRLTAVQKENADKDELASRRQVALRIKARELLEQGASEPGKRDTFANAGRELRDPGLRERNREASRQLAEVRKEEKALEEQRKNSEAANTKLGETIGKLSDRERQLLADRERAAAIAKKAAEANVKYANTTDEITAAIKTLQEENSQLELGDPEAEAKLNRNLVQIKRLQGLLEDLNKTPVELRIESAERGADILNSQDAIDFDPGPIREARKLVRDIGVDMKAASARFKESAAPWAEAISKGTDRTGKAGEKLKEAGQKFAQDLLKGTASLKDQLRSLLKARADANRSLTGLVLSKPEFFTPQEVRAAVNEAARLAQVEADKAGISFTTRGGTEIERAQENLSFAEARNQANDLRQTIVGIGEAVAVIAAKLLGDTPRANELLKKYGLDAKDLVQDVSEGIDDIAKKGPRIGEVFGEITANGQTSILFFDNLTGQTEQLSKAAFDAAVASDKLAGSVSKTGKDAKGAEGKIGALGTQVGQVFGTITADGRAQVQFFNKATGQVELLEKAAFDRLQKEQGITAEIDKQNTGLAASLKLAQAAGAVSGATGQGPDTGGVSFNPGGSQSAEQSAEQFREIARRNGGEYTRVLSEVIQTGGPGFLPQALLGSIQTDATRYKQALDTLKISQDQATQAQTAYNQALASGSPDLITYAASLANAKEALAASNLELQGAAPGYQQAAETAKELGIALESVPSLGETIGGTNELQTAEKSWREYVDSVLKGSKEIEESSKAWDEYASEAEDSIEDINSLSLEDPLEGAATGATTIEDSLSGAVTPAGDISKSLGAAADNAENIKKSIDKLQNLTVTIKVNGVPGFFTGGPVSAGQEVRVNELGKEGFLSRGGNLSPINVPANATWRPPTSGTIIPAHIWDKIEAPSGRVKASTSGPALRTGMSASQARQAQELGILGRAVDNLSGQVRALAAKDWTVKANVRNSAGNTQIRMMNALF